MKFLLLASLALVATASSFTGPQKQSQVLKLLFHLNDPIPLLFPFLSIGGDIYNPAKHLDDFKDEGKAAKILDEEYTSNRMMAKNQIFSLFNKRHLDEALMIFKVLMQSKSWTVFASSAAFYRENLNGGEFVYALYAAVTHSPLTQELVLPPLYEIAPHLFVTTDVINEIIDARLHNKGGHFRMNFTGTRSNPEQRVAYFGEDIGLNVHHSTWHVEQPFWWDDSYGYHLDRKGEVFFWVHHQLTARFDFERLSNNLDVVEELQWDKPIKEGFAPHLKYRHGGEFPVRPDNLNFRDVDGVATIPEMKAFESRILDAIAHGFAVDKDGNKVDLRNEGGIAILGDLLESSSYSVNPQYYGSFHNLAHVILGRQADPKGKYGLPPSVMEHFETATRDPSFFRLHKHIDNIFKAHKNSLPPYKVEDLEFPGVKVTDVQVEGELKTFFQDFDFDVSNAVDYPGSILDKHNNLNAPEMLVTVKRLSHTPFSLKIAVTNDNAKPVLGTFRVFLCPRKDANGILFEHNEGRWHCVELDKFWAKVNSGTQKVTRDMSEASTTIPDPISYRAMWDEMNKAILNSDESMPSHWVRPCGVPNRLLLPKGKPEGMEFSIFVAVTDGAKDAVNPDVEQHTRRAHAQCGHRDQKLPDTRPLGFPLDRYVPDRRIQAKLPNLHTSFVTIKHDPDH